MFMGKQIHGVAGHILFEGGGGANILFISIIGGNLVQFESSVAHTFSMSFSEDFHRSYTGSPKAQK